LTIVLWSNGQMRSYTGVTVHFISNEKLHSAMLPSCRRSQPALGRNSQQFWNY